MVSVSDVEIRNLVKLLGDGRYHFGVVNHPEVVSEAVRSSEVILRFAGSHLVNDSLQSLIVGESEKYRLDVGIVDTHMLHAVLLLVTARQFVLLDAPFHIVIHIGGYNDAILRATVHGLRIYIIVLLVVSDEPAVGLESVEVLDRLVIHPGVMLIGARGEIDLRLDDMIERARIAFGLSSGLLAVEHVIWTRCNLLDEFAGRTYALKWFYFCHNGDLFFAFDGLASVRTDGNYGYRSLELFFKEVDVVLEILGELGFTLHLGHIGLPAGESYVDWLDFIFLDREGELLYPLAIDFIGHASLDFVKVVEHIALHHDKLSHTVDHDGIFQSHEVNPAATAFASGDCTVFVTEITYAGTGLVMQLCGERAAAYTCAISLEDAKHLTDFVGGDAETRTCAGTHSVGRCHEWIAAEIHIEQGALCALAEDAFALTQHVVNDMFAVYQLVGLDVFDGIHPFLLQSCQLVSIGSSVKHSQTRHVSLLGCGILAVKVMQGVAEAQSVARDFVGVCRADAFACGAYFAGAFGFLVGCVEQTMGRHDEVGFLRYFEHLAQVNTARFESLGLFTEEDRVKHHSVAYDIGLPILEDTRRDGAQYILFTLKFKGVTGIGSALETCYSVVTRCQHVHYFSFAFVAPLEP